MMTSFGLLLVAVAVEVVATSLMPRTNGFREPGWTVLVLAGYAVSLALLALVVRTLPISVAYAVWAGLGTASVAVIGVVYLDESLGPLKVVAIVMIVVGVVLLNLGGVAH